MVQTQQFTAAEERKIQKAVEAELKRKRDKEIQAEIRRRLADEKRQIPGYKYY